MQNYRKSATSTNVLQKMKKTSRKFQIMLINLFSYGRKHTFSFSKTHISSGNGHFFFENGLFPVEMTIIFLKTRISGGNGHFLISKVPVSGGNAHFLISKVPVSGGNAHFRFLKVPVSGGNGHFLFSKVPVSNGNGHYFFENGCPGGWDSRFFSFIYLTTTRREAPPGPRRR